jgi:hypothetical protein
MHTFIQRFNFTALGLLLLASNAEAATYRAATTGEQLIRDMQGDPSVPLNSFKRARAMGYIDGIMDATASIQWCPPGKGVPHELNYRLIEDIHRLDAETLKGSATPVVIAALRKMFPCVAGGKS